jgi:hypothetical protein
MKKGAWTEEGARLWAWNVRHCRDSGPAALAELLVVLEDAIRPEWILNAAAPVLRW